jgi:uncharacterized Zn finger protein
MWWNDFYPRSKPKAVRGGIKAQTTRGAFGQSWWAKRWIAVLEGFDLGGRLTRGRSYARAGQVKSIAVGDGKVTAQVQGSRPSPYRVEIAVRQLDAREWSKVIARLTGQAAFAAKFLAGEMPHEIEEVFTAAGMTLFPARLDDLQTECSCPDWSNPCKHIAAVYYLLGEEFDRDPFLIFRLRGMDRPKLMKALGAGAKSTTPAPPAREPLPADPAVFWGGPVPADVVGPVSEPPVAAGALRRLGKFPFWRGDRPLVEMLEPVYRSAREAGVRAVAGDLE